jgi:hypothetical protein
MNDYCFVVRRLIISAETVLSGMGFFDTAFTSLTVLGVGLSVLFIQIQLILNYDLSKYLSSANTLNESRNCFNSCGWLLLKQGASTQLLK